MGGDERAPSAPSIEWIADRAAFAGLAAEWPAILPVDSRPFDEHPWYLAWWDSFVGGDGLEVAVARRDGRLAGCLPLGHDGGNLAGLVNRRSPTFRPLATDREALGAIAAAAVARQASELELQMLPAADPLIPALEDAAGPAGSRLLSGPRRDVPLVDTGGDYGAWLGEGGWRWGVAARRRELEAGRGGRIEVLREDGELDTAALSPEPRTESFYRAVAEAFRQRGELRQSRLELNGEVVARDLSLLHGGRLYSLATESAGSARDLDAGAVLQLAIVERCFELGLSGYEPYGAEEELAARLETGRREQVDLRLYPAGLSGGLRYRFRRNVRPGLGAARRALARR